MSINGYRSGPRPMSRATGMTDVIPPSYRSIVSADHEQDERGTIVSAAATATAAAVANDNPIISWRASAAEASALSSTVHVNAHGDSISPASSGVVVLDHPLDDGDQVLGGRARTNSSGLKLLAMHYLEESVLTRSADRYEDIEIAARALFFIDTNERLFISANISAYQRRRMRLDPNIWAAVYNEVEEIWITTKPRNAQITHMSEYTTTSSADTNNSTEAVPLLGPGTRTIKLVYVNEPVGPWTKVIQIPEVDATIMDVKKVFKALWRMNIYVGDYHVRPTRQPGRFTDVLPDTDPADKDVYNWYKK